MQRKLCRTTIMSNHNLVIGRSYPAMGWASSSLLQYISNGLDHFLLLFWMIKNDFRGLMMTSEDNSGNTLLKPIQKYNRTTRVMSNHVHTYTESYKHTTSLKFTKSRQQSQHLSLQSQEQIIIETHHKFNLKRLSKFMHSYHYQSNYSPIKRNFSATNTKIKILKRKYRTSLTNSADAVEIAGDYYSK